MASLKRVSSAWATPSNPCSADKVDNIVARVRLIVVGHCGTPFVYQNKSKGNHLGPPLLSLPLRVELSSTRELVESYLQERSYAKSQFPPLARFPGKLFASKND